MGTPIYTVFRGWWGWQFRAGHYNGESGPHWATDARGLSIEQVRVLVQEARAVGEIRWFTN